MLWANLIPLLLIATTLVALPSLSRRTVPLGVSVPTSRLDEPVVHQSLVRYRIGVLVSAVAVLALAVLLTPLAAVVADAGTPFLLLAAAGAVLVWARRPILQAKAVGGWYDGVPVRVSARVTAEAEPARVPWAWYWASMAVVGLTAITGAVLYDRQPDPYPVNWNGSGQPDSFVEKSVVAVLAPVAVMLVVVVLMALIAAAVQRAPERRYADGDPAGAEHRRVVMQRSIQTGLGAMTLLVTVGVAALQFVIWSGISGAILVIAGIGMTMLIAIGVLGMLVGFARATRGPATSAGPAGWASPGESAAPAAQTGGLPNDRRAAESPDDDSSWKCGLFYVNSDDPALFVPKRMGVGWTINFGRPAGVAIAVGTLVVIVGAVLLAALQQH